MLNIIFYIITIAISLIAGYVIGKRQTYKEVAIALTDLARKLGEILAEKH